MKLKTKYLLFVSILHLITLVLSFLIFKENKLIFIISEVFILISLGISWSLYQQLIQPLKMLVQGISAIKDQDFNVKFRLTGKYEVDELIGVYNKMIDSLRSERTLQEEQHKFLQKLINTSPTGVAILDFDHHIEQLNPKAKQLLGINEDNKLEEALPSASKPLIREIIELGAGESKIVSISGIENYKCQKSFFIDRGFPRYFVMLEELSIEILQTEKKAYGKVIRMMAHEVNNTIGPVNSIIDFALSKQEDAESSLGKALKIAIERNDSLNAFMRKLADVVRLPAANKQEIELNQLLSNIGQLFELRAHAQGVNIRYQLHHDAIRAIADIQQMEQVLVNILKNSLEAIDTPAGGEITLISEAAPKRIIVRDNGKGIAADVQVNLFTPFYSTKKDGQGVGLTLVREVLLNHGFAFSLKTTTTGETEFEIIVS